MDNYQYYARGPERACAKCGALIPENEGRYESTKIITKRGVLCTKCHRGKREYKRYNG